MNDSNAWVVGYAAPKRPDPFISTTITEPDGSGGFCAPTVTPASGSSETTRRILERLLTISKEAQHPSSQRFYDILLELAGLHARKQADYGRGDDPFANVRASEEWGIAPWVGAMVRLNDKVRRLQKAAQGGALANEGVVDSLMDIGVYAVIALVLYEQTGATDDVPF